VRGRKPTFLQKARGIPLRWEKDSARESKRGNMSHITGMKKKTGAAGGNPETDAIVGTIFLIVKLGSCNAV